MRQKNVTPGPWRLSETGYAIVTEPDGLHLAVVTHKADARLMVEAPAMLALLQQGLLIDAESRKGKGFHCTCPLCESARAIIARIEGIK